MRYITLVTLGGAGGRCSRKGAYDSQTCQSDVARVIVGHKINLGVLICVSASSHRRPSWKILFVTEA